MPRRPCPYCAAAARLAAVAAARGDTRLAHAVLAAADPTRDAPLRSIAAAARVHPRRLARALQRYDGWSRDVEAK